MLRWFRFAPPFTVWLFWRLATEPQGEHKKKAKKKIEDWPCGGGAHCGPPLEIPLIFPNSLYFGGRAGRPPLGFAGMRFLDLLACWPVVEEGPSSMRVQILSSCRNPMANLSAPLETGPRASIRGFLRWWHFLLRPAVISPAGAHLFFGPSSGGFALTPHSLSGWLGGWSPSHKAIAGKKLKKIENWP